MFFRLHAMPGFAYSSLSDFTWSGTEFVDTDVTPGTTYYYWIKVRGTDGAVNNSSVVSATIPSDAPEPTPAPDSGVVDGAYTWNAVLIKGGYVGVYRSTNAGATWEKLPNYPTALPPKAY
jgi:hypothetical protein